MDDLFQVAVVVREPLPLPGAKRPTGTPMFRGRPSVCGTHP
jgi:hypothetical protein